MGRLDAKRREERIVDQAVGILERRMRQSRARYQVSSPNTVRQYLRLRLGTLEREVLLVIFLDASLRVIATKELFQGTLTQTIVYPREVVKAAIRQNAHAIIIAHNHPGGSPQFSEEDEKLRQQLAAALALIDVKLLDSLVVAGAVITSWAEQQAIADFAERENDRRQDLEQKKRRSAAMAASWARRRAAQVSHGNP